MKLRDTYTKILGDELKHREKMEAILKPSQIKMLSEIADDTEIDF